MIEQAPGIRASHESGRITRYGTMVLLGATMGLVAWLGACSDSPCALCPPPPLDSGLIASDPIPASSAALSTSSALVRSLSAADSVVYVSLLPGTVQGGTYATIQVVGDPNTVSTSVVDGGFDPVPVQSGVGDLIDVVITDVGGAAVQRMRLTVALLRPPIVVRTNPPPRKRDHPFNAAIVVVFSEPVAPATVSPSSVRLFRGSTAISGNVHLLQGYTATAVFEPSQPLEANTDYRLEVTSSVRDLSGEALVSTSPVDFTTSATFVGTVNNVTVLPDTAAILIGSQLQLTATARDSFGVAVPGQPLTWSSDNSTVATVSATGLVTALAPGLAHVSAQGDNYQGAATVIVTASLAPVDSVIVTPETTTVPLGPGGGSVRLTAITLDSTGTLLPFRRVGWTTSNPAVATVTGGAGGKAWVTGAAPGTVTITATSEGHSDSARIAFITPGPFATVAPGGGHPYGGSHTCGVTTDAWLLCWGGNEQGQLGTGAVPNSYVPMGVGGRRFFMVSAQASDVVCALMVDSGSPYCWGSNWLGNLGIGPAAGPEYCGVYLGDPCSKEPIALQGGRQFTSIAHGSGYGCGLTAGGEAYCWGYNADGRLGTGSNVGPEQCDSYGTPVACSTVPVLVTGAPPFSSLVVGSDHACGLTTNGAAYCWGSNQSGQLGDSTRADRLTPVVVAGGLSFVALSAGHAHTCGLTADSSAYCWGDNENGQLGNGDTSSTGVRVAPDSVVGGLHFAFISAGGHHTCGVTGSGAAYCWGANWSGELGTGTSLDARIPVVVTGGLTFARVMASRGWNTCGVTVTRVAYCWGDNGRGQLGDGSTTASSVPVRIAGQP